jgi:dynein heavy chain
MTPLMRENVKQFLEDPDFKPDIVAKSSSAAASICSWVINIVRYKEVNDFVVPLIEGSEKAAEETAQAEGALLKARTAVAEVEAKVQALNEKLQQAEDDAAAVKEEADKGEKKLDLANRLVNGLSSENERWSREIHVLRDSEVTLIGDCMIAAGFVSYVGSFDQQNREFLVNRTWIPDLEERRIPLTLNVDPLSMLTDESRTAKMVSEGLPADRISNENGSIITNCKRWPLLIDPQTQGITWLRKKEKDNGLEVFQINQTGWQKKVTAAIENGTCIIIENLGEDIDATLDPVLSRAIFKNRGNFYIKFGGEDYEYHDTFKLYLQTKLANPHYKPEIAAQCTLINFIATERGLEDQLLAKVVGKERPDLEEKAQKLTSDEQLYKIQLKGLEDDLLSKLAGADENILEDLPLIEGLEATKKASREINAAVEEGKKTAVDINLAREIYRPMASEGAMLYFLLTKLCTIEHMYQYSLDSFVRYFYKAIDRAQSSDKIKERVGHLNSSLRITIYTMVSRGLYVRHKLIFLSQLTFNLMRRKNLGEDNALYDPYFQFLLRGGNSKAIGESEREKKPKWLSDPAWIKVLALGDMDEFRKLVEDIAEPSSTGRFKEWYDMLTPESEKLPLDHGSLDKEPFKKMLVVRCLHPDRVEPALTDFIKNTLPNGVSYTECDGSLSSLSVLENSLEDASCTVPIYFILSPGANVMGDLDTLASKADLIPGVTYHNVSMGQGQDLVAEDNLEKARRGGHWVVLNNVHLMPGWLIKLEKMLDGYAQDTQASHPDFRLFMSSDASNAIPIGLINRCIKITNEPPAGLKANIKRAFASLNKEQFEEADSKNKSILFGLCHFHSIMLERKRYGPMGYNMMYPFSIGDLRDSALILANYSDNLSSGKIPWADLKYLFGEIMYGGHIVNDFDRKLCATYLDYFMKDELLDETEMYPFNDEEKNLSFMSPPPSTFERYLEHIDTTLTVDTPIAFGLHPNAEIDFRTTQSNIILSTIFELQPRDSASAEGSLSPDEAVKLLTQEIIDNDKYNVVFDTEELIRGLKEQFGPDAVGPYQNVFIQEMDVMNNLLFEMKRSLLELLKGFKGELTMSDTMDQLKVALYMDRIPASWSKRAWPSLRPLGAWLLDFIKRLDQLREWENQPFEIPKVTWISGLYNPQSFLTAICQVTAQKNSLELDKLETWTDVRKNTNPEDLNPTSEGAYINGLSLQGARWDMTNAVIERSKPKEMFCPMPIINVKAVEKITKPEALAGYFICPTYKTEFRGPTYVFCAQLKTKYPAGKWVLAGVALIMDTQV